jgi:hypothetical protein
MEKVRPEVERLAWAMQELERRRKPKPRVKTHKITNNGVSEIGFIF